MPQQIPDPAAEALSAEQAAAGRVRLYRAATVLDGTGTARYVADVAVQGARVAAIVRAGEAQPPPPHRATVPLIESRIDAAAEAFEWTPGTPVHAPAELAAVAVLLSDRGAGGDADDPAITLVFDPEVGEDATAEGRIGAEAFRIAVAAAGIEVRGATAEGVFRDTATLCQLRTPESDIVHIPAGGWQGSPAYGWRGMMLDVARHFRPADDIRRLIDLLALHQLNVLHLHLTDDQGWRFEVPGYPRLTEIGARREATQRGHGPLARVEPGLHEGFYSTAELRELVEYAAARFITIVPEVELPGHVQAALAAYPALGNVDISGPDAEGPVTAPWERFGVNPRTLAPTAKSLAFGRAAIDALCDIFDSPWIGIGGDEVPITEWAESPAVAERMRELGLGSPQDVQPWFTAQYVEHVRSRGRTALAGDEVLEGDVPEGVQILAWRGPVALEEALRRGIPVVGCPDLETYLDYRQSESDDEPVPVGPPLTVERTYTLRLPEGVVGGQANVWTEHLPTRDRVDFAMFPRLSAIAERLWAGGDPGESDAFLRRLEVHLRRLTAAGVRYRPLDGPTRDQRRPGVPGKPMTVAAREHIVSDLVAGLRARPVHVARRGESQN